MKRIPVWHHRQIVGYALVDDEDAHLVEGRRWFLQNAGYPEANTRNVDNVRKRVLMHRVILGLSPGDGQITDHINRDKLDNRRENLRLVTASANAQNRIRPSGRYSRYRGVTRKNGQWAAVATVAQKQHYLGSFATEEEAAQAAAAWRAAHMPFSPEAAARAAAA
jgi:hypothetical protein